MGLKEKMDESDLRVLRKFRQTLRADNNAIDVKDFGAGSRVFKGSKRKVSQIAKSAGISQPRSKTLYKTVKYFDPGRILEIGTSLGMASAAMSLAAPKAKIDTLEGCPETAGVAQSMFDTFGLKNIAVHIGEFHTTLPEVLRNNAFDLIFFDGNHQKQATLDYFQMCFKGAHENSIFIFDDIHWSAEMEQAWNIIQEHEQVTLSIDTFQWGLIFFHPGREKEHFILRI
ncbi:MAG: class I SAM-dependent methyltransferase [Lutimonas sp.]